MGPAQYTLDDQQMMRHAVRYFEWQARLVLPHAGERVIEIGCGLGNFTGKLLDRELVVAVDRDPDLVARLRDRYTGAPNLRTEVCDAAGADLRRLAEYRADACVCLNVLEHIAEDRAALMNMAALVQPGGAIVLLVPAMPALYGPIDRNLGHFRRYTRRGLAQLAEGAGLRVERLHFVNAIGAAGWWWNARVRPRQAQSNTQIAWFDRLAVPVAELLEGWIRPPAGQSLLAVLRR